MDSFYDAPRRAPVPMQIKRVLEGPIVPEVSMLCSTKTAANNYMPYHTWKMQQHSVAYGNVLTSNRENVMRGLCNFNNPSQFASPQNTSQILKKQVRFESPVLQQRPSLTYEPFNKRKIDEKACKDCPNIEKQPALQGNEKLIVTSQKTSPTVPFEQIYMANLPNKHLDLSIIDLPNHSKKVAKPPIIQGETNYNTNIKSDENLNTHFHKNKENELPKTYREFLETQKKVAKENKAGLNESITDIFNYKRSQVSNINKNYSELKKQPATNPSKVIVQTQTNKGKNDLQKLHDVELCSHSDNQNSEEIKSFNQIENQQPHFLLGSKDDAINICPSYKFPEHNVCLLKCDSVTQTSIAYLEPDKDNMHKESSQKPKDDSEPTNKDLLKIIAQQNEQLLILQKQVAMLLNRDQQNQPKQIEAAPQPQRYNYIGEKCITSTQNENVRNPMQDINSTPRKRGLSKFSIDLMTSFEVAIRPQHNKQNFVNYEPKIQELTESDNGMTAGASSVDKDDKTVVDTSLHLQESVKVREMCPSPEPSININMNDYDSSDEDEVSASEIGATFYQNLMGQVNNILKKAQVQTKEDLAARDGLIDGVVSDKYKDKTMSRVKEATLKHLKNIGITIGPMSDTDDLASSSSGNDSKDYSPTEISFAVKQLLMKYLPDEQLAKITYKQTQSKPVIQKDEVPANIPCRPEFSFASMQYMKKYNLIPINNNKRPNSEQNPKAVQPHKVKGPKILDITALKMQPKLL